MTNSISPAQIRGGRAMLGISQEALAIEAGVTRKTMVGIEAEGSQSYASTRGKVVQVLRAKGIEFIWTESGPGVVLTQPAAHNAERAEAGPLG